MRYHASTDQRTIKYMDKKLEDTKAEAEKLRNLVNKMVVESGICFSMSVDAEGCRPDINGCVECCEQYFKEKDGEG